eukprot:gene27201-biopygen17740
MSRGGYSPPESSWLPIRAASSIPVASTLL